MSAPAGGRAVVAVDLGAQSCRVSLLRWHKSEPQISCVYRVANGPVVGLHGELRWNLAMLCEAAEEGLQRAAALAPEGIASIGVTGWAVDIVRLAPAGPGEPMRPIADPFCYRDARNDAAAEQLHRRIPAERLYEMTGIQVMPLNTVYQLFADGMAGIPAGLPWLNLPEYLLYRWGAPPVAEYTNATHTGLVSPGTMKWRPEIFSAAGLDLEAAPKIVPPGTILGRYAGRAAEMPGFRDTLLIAPACHDTASAVAGISAADGAGDWAFISSGTWSLVGTLLDRPCITPEVARENFTNLGGVGDKTCFLRNVSGLWLLSQCLQVWQQEGVTFQLEALLEEAQALPGPELLLNVDDPELLAPPHMPDAMVRQWQQKGGDANALRSPAAMVNVVLRSLAVRYAEVLHQAARLTGKDFKHICIVGGGSRNGWLNQLTEKAARVPVVCGAQESSTIGNFAVQLAALEGSRPGDGAGAAAVARWAAMFTSSESERLRLA